MNESEAAAQPVRPAPPSPRWRRLVVRLTIAVVAVAALAIGAVMVENWRGQKAWEDYRRAAEARGERLDWRACLPAPVPDDQNFAATPLLKPLFVNLAGQSPKARPADAEAFLRVARVDATLGSSKRRVPPRIGSVERNDLTDLKDWQRFYRGNTNFPQAAASQSPAVAVLQALKAFDAELGELQQAAARPQSRAPIAYPQSAPLDVHLPRLAQLKALATVLHLRAVARLESGQPQSALADVQLERRLAHVLRGQPLLICHLTRLASEMVLLQTVKDGLARHAWTDAHLVELEKLLAGVDLLSDLAQAWRGERAFMLAGLGALREGRLPRATVELFDKEAGAGEPAVSAPLLKGWFCQNQLALCRWYDQYALAAVDVTKRQVLPAIVAGFDQKEPKRTMRNRLAGLAIQPALKAALRTARVQAVVDQARVACALERHRLARGRWPENLAALTPQCIEKPPHDLITGQPLKYRRTDDGGYLLYSVGWNEKDDGGETALNNSNPPRPDPARGDWVWKGPAK